MLVGNPRKGLHRIRPSRDFPDQPPLLRLTVPNEFPKVSVKLHHLNVNPTKELLRSGYIPQGHDQKTFGQLQVVAP